MQIGIFEKFLDLKRTQYYIPVQYEKYFFEVAKFTFMR